MNMQSLNHLINSLRNVGTGANNNELMQIIKSRQARLDKAAQVTPFWLSLSFAPTGVGGNGVSLLSKASTHPLVIVAAISNFPNLFQVRLSTVRTGVYTSKRMLPPSAIAGSAPASKTNSNILQLPEPLLLPAGDQLVLDVVENQYGVYNANARFDISFLCVRVDKDARPVRFTDARDLRTIEKMRAGQPTQLIYLKMDVPFAGGGAETLRGLKSDSSDKPLLVTGAITNLTNSRLLLSDSGGELFSNDTVPMWAMASSITNNNNQYLTFTRPILLPAGSTLEAEAVNGMTTSGGAAFSYDNAGYIIFAGTTP